MSQNHQRAALQRILDASARRWEYLTRSCGCEPSHPEIKHLEKVMRIARGGLKRGT